MSIDHLDGGTIVSNEGICAVGLKCCRAKILSDVEIEYEQTIKNTFYTLNLELGRSGDWRSYFNSFSCQNCIWARYKFHVIWQSKTVTRSLNGFVSAIHTLSASYLLAY
jgi:hypothetical protein